MVSAPTSAMNHLLVGKNALVSGRSRQIGLSPVVATPKEKSISRLSPRSQSRKDKQGITLHWKDMKKRKDSNEMPDGMYLLNLYILLHFSTRTNQTNKFYKSGHSEMNI